MNSLRAFGNQRQIGRILFGRNIERLHKAAVHQRPNSVILYSPKHLVSPYSQPIHPVDFRPVFDWLSCTKHFILTRGTDTADDFITREKFEQIVDVAFNTLFDPFYCQSGPETVLFYYTGHGLTVDGASMMKELSDCMASPDLRDVGISKEMLVRAAKYINPKRPLKGGEFFLHQFGFCDLAGLLELWTTALTKSSTKNNKHLIVIADNCNSGMLVKDLQKLARTPAPWNLNGCTVTVQSASRSYEASLQTCFSPCFVHFNKPENRDSLRDLKERWSGMREKDKNK